MEEWQKNYISKNMPSLLKEINCDAIILAILEADKVLCEADIDELNTYRTFRGKLEQTRLLLDILITRSRGYEKLVKCLYITKQTGALKTILLGFDEAKRSLPLKDCDVPFAKDILSTTVLFQGVSCELKSILPKNLNEDFENLLMKSLDGKSYFQFMEGSEIVIANDQIPKNVPVYIPRTLSIRKTLNPCVFSGLSKDVFVFENIEISELTRLANGEKSAGSFSLFGSRRPKPEIILTGYSSEQIHKLTSRFILLERHEDFSLLVAIASAAIHWIFHEDDKFQLVCSHGGSSNIKSYLETYEHTFPQSSLLDNVSGNGNICISETPGMGKSILLCALAHETKKHFPHDLVVFLKFSELLENLGHEIAKANLIAYLVSVVSETAVGKFLLEYILNSGFGIIRLFIDGFDEVSNEQHKAAQEILSCFTKELCNSRLYITGRPHTCAEMERILSTLSYSILPFEIQDQINFLAECWKNKCGITKSLGIQKLTECAKTCLSFLKASLDSKDVETSIAGIPLQCKLLADVYLQEVKLVASQPTHKFRTYGHCASLMELYKAHYDQCFTKILNISVRNALKEYHTYESVKLLFPQMVTDNETGVVRNQIFSVGILEENKSNSTVKFVHRTFAEYIVAQFVVDAIKNKGACSWPAWMAENNSSFLLQGCFSTVETKIQDPFEETKCYKFTNTTLTYFIEKLIAKSLSDEDRSRFSLPNVVRPNYLDFLEKLVASTVSDCLEIFHILDMLYSADNKRKSIEKFRKYLPIVLLIATKFCRVELLQKVCGFVEDSLGISVYKLDGYKYTALEVAARCGRYHNFEYLMLNKYKELEKPKFLLHTCVMNSYSDTGRFIEDKLQIIKSILSYEDTKDCHINERDNNNNSPILMKSLHFELLACLINSGADLSHTTDAGNTVAHNAAECLNPEEFHLFCMLVFANKFQKIFSTQNDKNETPLHIAMKKIDLLNQTLKFLNRNAGVTFNNKNSFGVTELMTACRFNRSKTVVKAMVELGGDWKQGPFDFNALHFSVGSYELVEYFLSLGAKVTSGDCRPLVLFCGLCNTGTDFDVANLLIEKGANVNSCYYLRMTPLFAALHSGNLKLVQYILRRGANANQEGAFGLSSVSFVVSTNENRSFVLDSIKNLVEYGANVNHKNFQGYSSLHHAIGKFKGESFPIVEYLVQAGANLNAKSNFGLTPLHCVAIGNGKSYLDLAKLLVENGANVNSLDHNNRTPLWYAIKFGNELLSKYLIAQGGSSETSHETGDFNHLEEWYDYEYLKSDDAKISLLQYIQIAYLYFSHAGFRTLTKMNSFTDFLKEYFDLRSL